MEFLQILKIIITNKFNETSNIDIKRQIENAFKLFYKIQINKKQGKQVRI